MERAPLREAVEFAGYEDVDAGIVDWPMSVLRLTTEEHPLGLYHPHAELHHLKKENIGLIEVMGLAVLPARLKDELAAVADGLVSGANLHDSELTEKHAEWAEGFADRVTAENAQQVVEDEVGKAFATVLEHAGVYKNDPQGSAAFQRFISYVNGEDSTLSA